MTHLLSAYLRRASALAKKRSFHDDRDVVDHLVKTHVKNLTPWECDFLDSISMQLDTGRGLTERQGQRLDVIWEALVVRRER